LSKGCSIVYDVRTVLLGLCVVLATTGGLAQSPPGPQAPPQFRAGVDLMRIDVAVLDKQTRKPVRGLGAGDFEVIVGGTRQQVQTVSELETRAGTLTGS